MTCIECDTEIELPPDVELCCNPDEFLCQACIVPELADDDDDSDGNELPF